MDGVSRAVGSPLPMRLAGDLRLVEPLTLSMLGSIEMHLLHSVPELTEIVLRDFPDMDSQAAELLVYASEQDGKRLHFVPSDELHQYLDSQEGLVLALWLMTRRTAAGLRHEEIDAHVTACEPLDARRLARAVKLVSCLDERAEKDWIRIPTDGDEPERMNWKHLVRKLCEAYFGVTPRDVGDMTLFEVRLLSLGDGDVRGMRKTVGEFRRLQAEGKLDDVGIKWQPKKKRRA